MVDSIEHHLRAAQHGDEESFEHVYKHLVDKVFAFVMSRTSDREMALELTQDIFVELYKALKTFTYQHETAFYAFVYTIARRQLAQYYERKKAKEVTSFDETSMAAESATAAVSTEVARALERLDERSREIVVLHHWSRHTFGEIAALLGMNESAVRVRHHRAQQELATLLTR